jgi:hypothetical protein
VPIDKKTNNEKVKCNMPYDGDYRLNIYNGLETGQYFLGFWHGGYDFSDYDCSTIKIVIFPKN